MINLAPMTEADFQAYLTKIIPEYASEKVQAGNWTAEDSLERSRQEYERYLPQGINTPGHFIGNLLNENGDPVGYLWYFINDQRSGTAFIYDFEIYPPYRRLGYATQALEALEIHARTYGVRRLELHVFGHNIAARELYKKVGFVETNVNMARDI